MQSLQEFFFNLWQAVAIFLGILFWCFVAGVLCFFIYWLLKTWRKYLEDQHEAYMLDRWHARNQLIQAAVLDLDSPDPLQRILAETFIDSLLP